jgi:putative transposase
MLCVMPLAVSSARWLSEAYWLPHSKWECKYHIVWIPKYRKKSIYKDLRKYLGATLKDLASRNCQTL